MMPYKRTPDTEPESILISCRQSMMGKRKHSTMQVGILWTFNIRFTSMHPEYPRARFARLQILVQNHRDADRIGSGLTLTCSRGKEWRIVGAYTKLKKDSGYGSWSRMRGDGRAYCGHVLALRESMCKNGGMHIVFDIGGTNMRVAAALEVF